MTTLFLLAITASFSSAATSSGDSFTIRDTAGRVVGICPEGKCACSEWQIRLFTRDRKEWGMIVAKTLPLVRKRLADRQKSDVQWARFTGRPIDEDRYNYQHPGDPVCIAGSPALPPSFIDALTRKRDEAEKTLGKLLYKLGKRASNDISTLRNLGKIEGEHFKEVGRVTADYVNALAMMYDKLMELRHSLDRHVRKGEDLGLTLDRIGKDLEKADRDADAKWNRLPDAIKAKFTGDVGGDSAPRPPSSSGASGAWRNQRVRDFDKTYSTQKIEIEGKAVVVTQQREDNPAARVTYEFSSADIVRDRIEILSPDGGRWVVVVPTSGRKVTKKSSDGNGPPITDGISKATLWFSSGEDAGAAANEMRALP